MKPVVATAVGTVLLLTLANCAQNPVTGNPDFVTMSESQEAQTGRQEDVKVRRGYGVYANQALQQDVSDLRLQKVGDESGPRLKIIES